MPRKGHVKKRESVPDIRFGDQAASRFISSLMMGGKRSTAERIFYGALEKAGEKLGVEPYEVFQKAMGNVAPQIEVRPRRVGGATYQVPVEVTPTTLSARFSPASVVSRIPSVGTAPSTMSTMSLRSPRPGWLTVISRVSVLLPLGSTA